MVVEVYVVREAVHENDRRFRPRVISDVDPVLVPLNKSLLVGHHSLGTECHITDRVCAAGCGRPQWWVLVLTAAVARRQTDINPAPARAAALGLRAARRPLRSRARLRILVVRCGVPCDPRGWGSFMNRMIPRFHGAISGLTLIGKSCECSRRPCSAVE